VTGPLERLLQGPPQELTLYGPESRYHGVPLAETTLPGGRRVRYLRRRFLPPLDPLASAVLHVVHDGDRLDNLAARYLGDPLAAWRIADANDTLRPEALVEATGRKVRIALPGAGGRS
jgi:hypothetical protein